ncbi:hypothetical protein B9Z55_028838 [Caenorhabditis nigoni]|uniref:Homeobox domain-containing protein n=1 Tax=Caenorhabditis nigoni TaxID=1611254 RepID=A0A2G5SA93_9PELO|nr:hypothetical protein B9Z55_028838 [Caenorhabditis nigoni]
MISLRTRKAPASVQEASKGPNPKNRRLIESSELEEDDDREARPERKSAKHANHNESDSDFDDFEERTKRTMSNRKSQFSRLAQNDNRKERARMGIKVTFTDEQTQLLLAVFQENHYPSLDQQGSGGR